MTLDNLVPLPFFDSLTSIKKLEFDLLFQTLVCMKVKI